MALFQNLMGFSIGILWFASSSCFLSIVWGQIGSELGYPISRDEFCCLKQLSRPVGRKRTPLFQVLWFSDIFPPFFLKIGPSRLYKKRTWCSFPWFLSFCCFSFHSKYGCHEWPIDASVSWWIFFRKTWGSESLMQCKEKASWMADGRGGVAPTLRWLSGPGGWIKQTCFWKKKHEEIEEVGNSGVVRCEISIMYGIGLMEGWL